MLKDNQVSTVLLLVALGFLIYYLTKPSVVSEGFAEQEAKAEAKTDAKSEAEAKSEAKAEVRPELLNQILAEAESEKPAAAAEISGTAGMDVFGFEPSDVNEVGAQLEAAFQRPIPQEARTDVVDVNKNNVKKYDAKDFLPKEVNNQWFDTDFSQAKFNVNDDKLINTERYVIGVNTVGQSLKNASYDIRGTIPNPKFTVSPWNNSTYEADYNLKPLC
jgi:hypothetical protein